MERMKTLAKLALVGLLTIGCGCSKQQKATTPDNAPAKHDKTEDVKDFRLDHSDGWKQVKSGDDDEEPGGGARILEVWQTHVDDVPVNTFIIGADIGKDAPETFIDGVKQAAYARTSARIVKEEEGELDGGRKGWLSLDVRMTSDGDKVIVLTLVTTSEKRGYVVSCGADVSVYKAMVPLCSDLLKGFHVSK